MYTMPFGHDFWISMRYLLNKLFLEKNHFVNGVSGVKIVHRNYCYCPFQHHRWPPCGNVHDVTFWFFDVSTAPMETTQDSL